MTQLETDVAHRTILDQVIRFVKEIEPPPWWSAAERSRRNELIELAIVLWEHAQERITRYNHHPQPTGAADADETS